MTRRDDDPPLILRLTGRRVIPATAVDEELLFGFKTGTELEVRKAREPRSVARAAWWALMDAVVWYSDEWHSARGLSNALLLRMGLYESEKLVAGYRREPMSLKDFTEAETWRLVETAKLIIAIDITPDIDPDLLLQEKKRASRR